MTAKRAEYSNWVTMDGGYETTKSPAIIQTTLNMIKGDRILVSIIFKGYQSSGTVLYEINNNIIKIDKPKDWPGKIKKIRIVFKNEINIWMHFVVSVLKTTSDSLHCSIPISLFKLQRRNHYRVGLPQKSKVLFSYNNEICTYQLKDLSAGGMLIFSKTDPTFFQDSSHISKIKLILPFEETPESPEGKLITLFAKEAELVREFIQQEPFMLFCFGFRFFCTKSEEEKILRYVRQRELEVLRKGLSNK